MGNDTTSRRRFVAAAIALSGATASASLLKPISAWAQSGADSRPDADMVRFARLLYPHDALDDDVYAQVLGDAISAVADDDVVATQLDDVGVLLDTQAGGDFLAADEDTQVNAMRGVEQAAAFAAIRVRIRDGLYLHPACWKVVGYGGPSFQHGGYLHRGAGEIDWLPEGE